MVVEVFDSRQLSEICVVSPDGGFMGQGGAKDQAGHRQLMLETNFCGPHGQVPGQLNHRSLAHGGYRLRAGFSPAYRKGVRPKF